MAGEISSWEDLEEEQEVSRRGKAGGGGGKGCRKNAYEGKGRRKETRGGEEGRQGEERGGDND